MKNPIFCFHKKTMLFFIVLIFFIVLHFSLYFNNFNYKRVVDSVSENIFHGFKFLEKEMSEDDGNIFFVSSSGEFINLGTKKPTLTLPSGEKYEYENGVFIFNIKENLTIKASGCGVVKAVGMLENGLKFVEIRHSNNVITRYENLKVVGVGQNYNVKNVNVIGTCEEESGFIFKVFKGGKLLTDIVVENGEIKWEN